MALTAVMLVLAVGTDPADARHRRRHHRVFSGGSYHPAYAAIVVDANSGEVMHAANADSPRHPASITKIMTLYLLFEQLEAGRISLDTRLPVSEEAASQAPTKLGVRPGQTITVEEAIKGLVTKSANDAAVVIAEALGGDQETFATAMTRKARALGMMNTVYRNANGLPNDEQVTTARDQALLGRAIQERFPRFYRYFSTPSFVFHGHAMRNHNRLLGRVQGVDGIKTGYTRASGFNLVTSVRRGNRHIVAVVLGGASAGARDARMRTLIEEYIADASTQHTAGRITERGETAIATIQPPPVAPTIAAATLAPPAAAPAPVATARADDMRPVAELAAPPNAAPRVAAGSTEPIRAIKVKTLTVRPGALRTAALTPVEPSPQIPHNVAPAPAPTQAAAPPAASTLAQRETVASADQVAPATAAPTAAAPAPEMRRSGWIIQIGAFPAEDEAKERLKSARTLVKGLLGRADPFTERVVKGETTLFRARFAGLDENRAEAACKQLKRNKIACFAVKN